MKSILTLIIFSLVCQFTTKGAPKFPAPGSADFAQLRSNLYIVSTNDTTILMDGSLTQYDSDYSNNVDGMDARKMSNFSENWGMLRNTTTLVIERRHSIINTDSIFFKMWNMRTITYQIEFIASKLDKEGRVGILEDKYLHTSTLVALNDTTRIKFSVTADPASKAPDRFRLVFTTSAAWGLLPLTFISVKAFQQNNSVYIDWKTVNEINMKQYEVERSSDNTHFEKISEIEANNLSFNAYKWPDLNPVLGNNYYRIRSIDLNGKSNYSKITKVYMGKGKKEILVYPNPATGNCLNLQLVNQQAGLYKVRLLNSFGQTFMTKSIQHIGGSITQNLKPGQNVPKGIYQLEIKTPLGDTKIISVLF